MCRTGPVRVDVRGDGVTCVLWQVKPKQMRARRKNQEMVCGERWKKTSKPFVLKTKCWEIFYTMFINNKQER